MSLLSSRRTVRRTVEVEVDLTVEDFTSDIGDVDLAALCHDRGLVCFAPIESAGVAKGRLKGVLVTEDDIEAMADLFRGGDLDGVLLLLDRLMPYRVRNFTRAFGASLRRVA